LYIPLHHAKVSKRLLKKLLFKKVLTFSALSLIIDNVRRASKPRNPVVANAEKVQEENLKKVSETP
jgi:spore coat polysaccharide biosynthesis protein SpsF (cytidylyltransferase family)